MKATRSVKENGGTVNYSAPERFLLQCKVCNGRNVDMTIKAGKLTICCRNCGQEEK